MASWSFCQKCSDIVWVDSHVCGEKPQSIWSENVNLTSDVIGISSRTNDSFIVLDEHVQNVPSNITLSTAPIVSQDEIIGEPSEGQMQEDTENLLRGSVLCNVSRANESNVNQNLLQPSEVRVQEENERRLRASLSRMLRNREHESQTAFYPRMDIHQISHMPTASSDRICFPHVLNTDNTTEALNDGFEFTRAEERYFNSTDYPRAVSRSSREFSESRVDESPITESTDTVKSHNKTESGGQIFTCPVCSKMCSKKYRNRHMKLHESSHHYKCEFCERTFFWKCRLVMHRRFHTDEKPYRCEECSKSFTQRCDLVRHKRTHTCEKPYTCRFCLKLFGYASSCRKHERSHTNETPYKCAHCGKIFSLQSYLDRHYEICRGITGDEQ